MRKLENRELDEIGKAVVKANAFSSRDIDEIVANPALFDAVRARVKSTAEARSKQQSFIGPGIGALASIALVAVVALAFLVFRSTPHDDVVVRPTTPIAPKIGDTKRFPEPDKIADSSFSTSATVVKAERISTRQNVKLDRPKQPAAQQVGYEGDFYALSYAGDPNETERGGRIVRVDIPRSTLFAMGVDIPLENESETVKADLLVGSDGVTRAIRVVK